MRCERCDGRGWIEKPYIAGVVNVMHPCERCHGSGIDHCCDGDQRQPGEPSDRHD